MFLYTIFLAVTLVTTAAAQVQFLGVAIAGGDFGCQIDGTCPTGSTQLPLGSNGGGGDGPGQIQHWTSLDKPLNLFRLPVSWQFLANNQLGGDLDSNNLGKYDKLVQACLSTGAHCMIDIHNFARWNGGIIGQGGPTDDQFVALWTQLATKYAAQDRMVFELMNEPHDLDINVWAATCQKVVAAIRGAGATSQMILLPGTNFDSAATLVSSGSTAALMNITNPDGTTDNLLLDIHKYLDEDNSGTHKTCTTDNVDAFTTVADFLRQTGRKGIVSETGASSDSTVSAPCATTYSHRFLFICCIAPAGIWGHLKNQPLITYVGTVLHKFLLPEQLHQPKLRRLHGPRRLGRRQLRHELHPQPHAVEAEQPARRQPAHAAVRDSQVGRHRRHPELCGCGRASRLRVAGDGDEQADRDDDGGAHPGDQRAPVHRRRDVYHDHVDDDGDRGWRRGG